MSNKEQIVNEKLVDVIVHIDVNNLTSVLDDTSPVTAESVVKEGKKMIEAFPNGIQLENIMDAVVIVMGTTNKILKLTADQKKDFICDILIYVVDNTDAGALESMDPIIKKMIPSVIDAFLNIENGKLVIDKPKSIVKKVFFCCNSN